MAFSLALAAVFAVGSVAAWRPRRNFVLSIEAALFSLSAPGLDLHVLLPKRKKPAARKLILVFGGCAGILFSLKTRNSLDLEGFFMLLLCATMGAAIGHRLS